MKIESVLYIYIYLHIHTYMYTLTCIHAYMSTYTYIHTHIRVVVISAMLLTTNVVLSVCWCPWAPLDPGIIHHCNCCVHVRSWIRTKWWYDVGKSDHCDS